MYHMLTPQAKWPIWDHSEIIKDYAGNIIKGDGNLLYKNRKQNTAILLYDAKT